MMKEIPKQQYERLACWMADFEDSTLLQETMPAKDVDTYLLDEAFDIFYELYQVYTDGEEDSNLVTFDIHNSPPEEE